MVTAPARKRELLAEISRRPSARWQAAAHWDHIAKLREHRALFEAHRLASL